MNNNLIKILWLLFLLLCQLGTYIFCKKNTIKYSNINFVNSWSMTKLLILPLTVIALCIKFIYSITIVDYSNYFIYALTFIDSFYYIVIEMIYESYHIDVLVGACVNVITIMLANETPFETFTCLLIYLVFFTESIMYTTDIFIKELCSDVQLPTHYNDWFSLEKKSLNKILLFKLVNFTIWVFFQHIVLYIFTLYYMINYGRYNVIYIAIILFKHSIDIFKTVTMYNQIIELYKKMT